MTIKRWCEPMRLIILGGSGFVGQAIANVASQRQMAVISISRGGKSKHTSCISKKITWVSADVFQPESWAKYVRKGDVVIDAIGIFFQQSKKGITYKRMHYEAANLSAQIAKDQDASCFIYISAAHGIPIFKDYFVWKQRAEKSIQEIMGNVLIFKPSLLYSQHHQYWMAKGILMAKKVPVLRFFFKKINPMEINEFANSLLTKIS